MIRFERTRDYALVASIMRRPELYRWLADDFYPEAEEFLPAGRETTWYVLAFDSLTEDGSPSDELLGLFITHPINSILWEVHHALLPSSWGGRAHQIGLAFERFLWEFTPAQTAVGFTPACNVLAVRYARRHGMTEAGRIPRAFQRGGELFDILIFSKSRY